MKMQAYARELTRCNSSLRIQLNNINYTELYRAMLTTVVSCECYNTAK